MIAIFDRPRKMGKIAVNAFQVTKVLAGTSNECTIFFTSGMWETVIGSLEETIKKLNGFIDA